MITYHKIQTVFLRDPATNYKTLLEGEFSKPDFEFLANNLWQWTEKIDGTNIRVKFNNASEGFPPMLEFAGKTDNANLHPHLFTRLQELFPVEKLAEIFPATENVCLYGEGFGAGIQSGGYYQMEKDFILFDVKIGDIWLERSNVEDIASKLGCRIVPIVGEGSLFEAVEFARSGYLSTIAKTAHRAEGLIMKPKTELFNRRGERVITKIKFVDFKK